jgi:hypothetical protein
MDASTQAHRFLSALALASLIGLADPGGHSAQAQASGPLDHFKCYTARETGTPRFASRGVSLADQFGTGTATVVRPKRLCTPVAKNGEALHDPTAHLVCYGLAGGASARRDVLVRNQFGDQALTVSRAESLCVPAEKNAVASSLQVDHFKCYRARGRGFSARGVTLADQFETAPLTVVRPRLLCNPVDKNGEGILDPAAHLVCYVLRPGSAAARDVTLVDQFATQDARTLRLSTRRAWALCVPSEKNPSAPTTTTTSTSSTSTAPAASTSTTSTTLTTSTTAPLCGNGVTDPGEQCDPPGSLTCPPSSAGGAFTACSGACTCPGLPSTTSTSHTSTTSTTSTTVALCCGPQRIVLRSSSGTLQVDNLPPFTFPSGVITTLDTAAATGGAACAHDVVVPGGGFSVPNFDIAALNYCSSVTANGCESGTGDGAGRLWDGHGTAGAALTNVSKSADTSDGVCNPAGQPCNTSAGGAGANTLGDIDSTVTAAPGGGVRSLVDIPVHSLTWSDSTCSPAVTPGCCVSATFDPADGDLTITEFDFVLSPTTNAATGVFADKNGDGCFRAGSGFDNAAPGANGPKTLTGSPAAGPCCTIGQPTTVVSVGEAFSGAAPLFDLGFKSTIPNTVSACGAPGGATCTVTTDPCLQ